MRKLGIPDSAGITGRTLGHTVKLPAAVTHISNFFGDSSESPKRFTTATHKCVSLFWQIFFGTFLDKVQKGHHA